MASISSDRLIRPFHLWRRSGAGGHQALVQAPFHYPPRAQRPDDLGPGRTRVLLHPVGRVRPPPHPLTFSPFREAQAGPARRGRAWRALLPDLGRGEDDYGAADEADGVLRRVLAAERRPAEGRVWAAARADAGSPVCRPPKLQRMSAAAAATSAANWGGGWGGGPCRRASRAPSGASAARSWRRAPAPAERGPLSGCRERGALESAVLSFEAQNTVPDQDTDNKRNDNYSRSR
jgi:hypothetical protein